MKDQRTLYPLPLSSLATLLAPIFARHSRLLRCLLIVAICAGVVAYLQGTKARVAPPQPMIYVVTNTSDGGPGSFRRAIEDANANPGPDTINFNIPGTGVQTIKPASELPTISDQVIIDGYTQPGASVNTLASGDNAVLLIELEGDAGQFSNGLTISAGSSTVRGLVINRFNGFGILVITGGGNIIEGNFIGTDANGTLDQGNTYAGINVFGTPNNRIGGTTAVARNIISGNNNEGVTLLAGANDNTIQGNFIGTDINGIADLGNALSGVLISNAHNNSIGGATAGAGNVISGNDVGGLEISGASSGGNVVLGNLIGTKASGAAALPNANNGIRISNSANSNTVGGTTAAARNIISGNNGNGLTLNTGATSNSIQGNFIGTNISGTAALGNQNWGVAIAFSDNNTVGGATTFGAGNVISGNGAGVVINGPATGNLVAGNLVGTNAAGTAALPNGIGIQLAGANFNTIGGTTAAARNIISGNIEGLTLVSAATANAIQGNFIGTDISGTAAIGNTRGLNIQGASNNSIGGTTAGAGNVISGNLLQGVVMAGSQNLVAGNLIGTNAAGTAALPNGGSGIQLFAVTSTTIGGTTAAARNVISGNGLNGVALDPGANGNFIQGNFIGTDISGTVGLGNARNGVLIDGADNNIIGGTTAATRNIISANVIDGVRINFGARNAVLSNSIFSNGGLGIRLAPFANNNQAPPSITSVSSSGGFTTIQGTATGPPNTTGTVQFFANDACDSSGSGEGQIFLGSVPVEFQANGSAPGSGATLPVTIAPGQVVTATTTDANNNTSAFSLCSAVSNTSFNISGRVLDDNGNAISGLPLALNGEVVINTDANGNYAFAALAAGGNHTVTAASATYSFSPPSYTFNNLSVNRIANFVGTLTIVSISGKVTDGNDVGINNVTLALTMNGTAAGTLQTDLLGNYSFGNLTSGADYMVTPAGSFAPSSQTFSNLTVSAIANFKAAPSIPPQCSTLGFAINDRPAGSSPRSVAIGDFNGDHELDLAVANQNSNNVSILLGTGTGTFGPVNNVVVGLSPQSVAVGDFDGDDDLDLAVANQNSNSVSILLGTGSGNFSAAPSSPPVGTTPFYIAVGDFDGNGKPDLAVANSGSGDVSILLGTAMGSFSAKPSLPLTAGPRSLAVGDFNSDGWIDLAVATSGNLSSGDGSIWLGTGTGNFTGPTYLAVGPNPSHVAVGDFDSDGQVDLAVANFGPAGVSILLGTGNGNFGNATSFPVGIGVFAGTVSVAPGDFNGDGKLDLAAANSGSGPFNPSTANVSILLGTGTGSFRPPTNFFVGGPSPGRPLSVAVGDFNDDSKLDVATANSNFDGASVLLNSGPTCNTVTSLSISGRIADSTNNPLTGVTVTLSGPVTRVVPTDAGGNYIFPNLAPGGNYAVTVQSPYFVFAPSRVDFFNLGGNETVNFVAAPVAVPTPTPPLSVDFTGMRDPGKWTLGTQTQPASLFDPQITAAQVNGQLVVSPVNQASGMHYNGFVSANSFDLTNGAATVEVVTAATGADTIFAIGTDLNNFFRFVVQAAVGAPPQLVLQVKSSGQLTSLAVPYDPVQHRFMRFRHEPPALSPPNGAIFFETSPDNINFTVLHTVPLQNGLNPMTAELSAGTSTPANPGQAIFDNFTLTTSRFQFSAGSYTVGEENGSVLITVTRVGGTSVPGSVDYATSDGTALQGTKYVNAAGTLAFAAGETFKTFSVPIVNNNVAEGTQRLSLLLSNPTNSSLNNPGRAVLTIIDDDTAICTFTLSPTGALATGSGGTGSVGVTPIAAGCGWTATSNASWITVTSGASGSGNGTVSYSVAANPSVNARTGTLTIAGLTFVVNQGGATSLTISGHITDAADNPLLDVKVTLSGPITRMTLSDAKGDYSFTGLPPGGPYTVTVQSAFYVFVPSSVAFTNLTSNEIAPTFKAAPVLIPPPPPPLRDDFSGPGPSPDRVNWNFGAQSQSVPSDPAVTVAQVDGKLVITPLFPRTSGIHYNGIVSVDSFDINNGNAVVEVDQVAGDGADTIFAMGTDSNNFFRFMVHTADAPTSAITVKGLDAISVTQQATTAQLILQVKLNGQLAQLGVPIDYVREKHRFLRFRHKPPSEFPPRGAIAFEASADGITYEFLHDTPIDDKPLEAMNIELSAGTTRPGNSLMSELSALTTGPTATPEPAKFDSVSVNTFPSSPGNFRTVLVANQVAIQTWTLLSGRTYAYLRLTFPNAGYRVANWGVPGKVGNDFSADASIERVTGGSVQAVTTTAQIYDLGALANGAYTFTFKNSGTVVKSHSFNVSSATPPSNPSDDPQEFVKQHYRDFLNREADQAGLDFWTDNIAKCDDPLRRPAEQTVAQCRTRQFEATSAAFFLSPEFQYTGYYVYRMYRGVLGRPPKLSEFKPDAQFVGAGIVVNGQLSAAKINQNKADYARQFSDCADAAKYRCAEFKSIYDGLNNQQYVDRLFQTTGVNASASERAALVNGLTGGTETRAGVLQKVVDGAVVISEGNQQFTTLYGKTFYEQQLTPAFVQLEYFGYLQRDPDDGGYAFWLAKLNAAGGNFVKAQMVLAFITSPEYRARFGQP